MSVGKEVRTKIRSIKSTGKITSAMQLVAASKMRKTQEQMKRSKPYADKMRQAIGHVAASHSEYRHPYLVQHDRDQNIGVIIVSSDRGLCGGLNINLFRTVVKQMQTWQESGKSVSLCLIGKKAQSFFSRMGGEVVGVAEKVGEQPSVADVVGVVKTMMDAYDEKKLDRLYVMYNVFENTMTQTPRLLQLLPLEVSEDESLKHHWDYIYEPESAPVLDVMLKRYIESQVYQSVVENVACEQAARMLAMQNATDNAKQIVDDLTLVYNKARQAAITQEISEIVGGAAAVS